MNKDTIKVLSKISILTIIIVVFLASIDFLFIEKKQEVLEENKYSFKSADSSKLGNVGVAISTNIGIGFTKRKNTPIESYKDIPILESMIGDSDTVVKEIVETNMLTIKEYLNLLKTDVLKLLNSSINRQNSLENFISQLELRYKNGVSNKSVLNNYKTTIYNSMTNTQNKIDTLKIKIDSDAKRFDSKASLENIDEYSKLKADYFRAKIIGVFVNHFIKQYDFLNSYNKNLLDTLINNKEALINKWHIVMPNSGDNYLKEFNLIYDEADWKNEQKKEEE